MIRMSDKATTDNEGMIFNGGVFVRRYLFAIPLLRLLLLHLPGIMCLLLARLQPAVQSAGRAGSQAGRHRAPSFVVDTKYV